MQRIMLVPNDVAVIRPRARRRTCPGPYAKRAAHYLIRKKQRGEGRRGSCSLGNNFGAIWRGVLSRSG